MICKPICKYLLCVTVLCDQRMMSRCLHIENLAAFLSSSPVHTTKFSLASFICSCAQHKLTSFSLTRSLVQKLVMPSFWTRKMVRVYGPAWKTLSSCTHEQRKLVEENLRGKNHCSLYTRASKATKELVKENLAVWAGLYFLSIVLMTRNRD